MFFRKEHPFHSTTTLLRPVFHCPANLLQTNTMPHPCPICFHSIPLPMLRHTQYLKNLNGIHTPKHTIPLAHRKNDLS